MRVKRKIPKYGDGGKVVKDDSKQVVAKRQASPGLGGALKDFARAVGGAVAPKQVTKRKSTIDKAIEEAGG